MSEEQKDNMENVYEKLVKNLSPDLAQDRFYQYFMNLLETGSNYCSYFSSHMVKNIDEEWINAIEEALPSLQHVVLNPRKFIEEDRQIVNVAMARNITPETIQHLLQHSNMIDKVNEDGTVVPNRLLNVYKEESYNTYENRFIATLILNLQQFINKRFDVIFDNSRDEMGTFFEMESRHDYDRIGYKIDMVKQEPMITRELEQDIYNSFIWDYVMLKHYTQQNDFMNLDRPRRTKEITVKYIRQALDEIIRGLDMSDANVRKLIMNELSDLQLKRKMEKMNALRSDYRSGTGHGALPFRIPDSPGGQRQYAAHHSKRHLYSGEKAGGRGHPGRGHHYICLR